jgi:DNA-binding response OmpR family regulator
MTKTPDIERAAIRKATVLSVGPTDPDDDCLERIFHASDWSAYTNSEWTLITTATLASAFSVLGIVSIPIVLCDCELKPGTWQEMLDYLSLLPDPPLLILSSRLPDERIWSEALNLGAYDILAKPYDPPEVIRIVSLAWQHWLDRHDIHNDVTERRKVVQRHRRASIFTREQE